MGRSHQFAALFSRNSHRRKELEKISVGQMAILILALSGTSTFIGGQENSPFYRN
jgi:hypothetical protein